MTDSGAVSPARIRTIAAFSELDDDALAQVAELATARSYQEGDELLHHGDWPEDLLALERGEVEVRRDGEVLAKLGGGCVVGERGVIRRALRNADVVAVTPVEALFFHRNKVTTLRQDLPDLAERLQALADEREH